MSTTVPASRIRALNAHPLNRRGDFILYWMVAARRTRWNFALQHAVDLCVELDAPLLILEPLDVDYPWASDRLHRFVLDGMAANRAACRRSRAAYYPYVEPAPRRGAGLIAALSRYAPARSSRTPSPHSSSHGSRGRRLTKAAVRVEAVDSNGLIPLSAHGRAFTTARSYRAFVQRELRPHLREFPVEHPLRALPRGPAATLPPAIAKRWPAAATVLDRHAPLAALPIDHTVPPAPLRGGELAGRRRLAAFVESEPRAIWPRAQPSRRGRHEPAVPLPAFRARRRLTRSSPPS